MTGVIFIFLPLLFSLLTALSRGATEAVSAKLVTRMSTLGAFAFPLVLLARLGGFLPKVVQFNPLFRARDYSFDPVFLFDEKAFCLLGLSAFLYWIIVRFSRVYLHREEGFQRFFRTLFLSQFGLNLIATAGNLGLLFVGWEIVGLTSFLLISFYRDRAIPVWNAFRIYIVYRICDIGILLGAFLAHHQFGGEQHFLSIDRALVAANFASHPVAATLLGLAILLAALGKSAQFPFSFWLARALEGPTPSTAVFYGALSIHAGIFLLLRTQSLWISIPSVRILVGLFGALSLVVGTLSGRAQANIKGQIGYASIAQVGVMFVELAMGWDDLVLIHLCSHAILRAYQFLTSPSVVAHFIRHPVQEGEIFISGFSRRPWIRRLSVGEFFLEQFWTDCLVRPLRFIGGSWPALAAIGALLGLLGFVFFPGNFVFVTLTLACIVSLRAVACRDGQRSAVLVVFSIFLSVLSGSFFSKDLMVLGTCLLGIIPGLFFWFSGFPPLVFLGWLCLAGFPISPYFIGEDLLLHHLSEGGPAPLILFFFIFALNGISLARSFVQVTWLKTARPFD